MKWLKIETSVNVYRIRKGESLQIEAYNSLGFSIFLVVSGGYGGVVEGTRSENENLNHGSVGFSVVDVRWFLKREK